MARGAGRVYEVCSDSIGTLESGSRAIGRLGQNHECDEHEECGNIQEELSHGRIIRNWKTWRKRPLLLPTQRRFAGVIELDR